MAANIKLADRWFERRTQADGITQLWEPHAHPLIRCNIWHIRGRDRDLLIDTGLGIASLSDELADLLDKPLITLATHAHFDHVGGLHEFETRLMHPQEARLMDPFYDHATLMRELMSGQMLEYLASVGYPIHADELIDALPRHGFDPSGYSINAVLPTQLVDEGDVVDLGDRRFEVLHLPGHTPGSIGLWEASTGTLFSGDAIYDGPLLDELPESDIVQYINTMKRLRDYPVSVVHAGHETSFGRDRLRVLANRYLQQRDQ